MNIKRFLAAVLFLLILLSLVGIQGVTAQGGLDPPESKIFTLSLKDTTNTTVRYEDEVVIQIQLEVKNNDEVTREAVVSMVHDLNETMFETFKDRVELESNDTKFVAFSIELDNPLPLAIGETETIYFNVRPDNRSNDIESTLVITLRAEEYYRFKFEELTASNKDVSIKDEKLLEGNPIRINFTGEYTGNINASLVAKLFLVKEEIDSKSIKVSPDDKVELKLEWKNPPPGEYELKVKVYEEDSDDIPLAEEPVDITVEEKYEIPWFAWIGSGIIILIVFLSITIFIRQSRKTQINGNSVTNNNSQIKPAAVVPTGKPTVKEKPRKASKKKGKKKKGKKKGKKKKGKKKSQAPVQQETVRPLTQPLPERSPDSQPIGEPPVQQIHEYSEPVERKT